MADAVAIFEEELALSLTTEQSTAFRECNGTAMITPECEMKTYNELSREIGISFLKTWFYFTT